MILLLSVINIVSFTWTVNYNSACWISCALCGAVQTVLLRHVNVNNADVSNLRCTINSVASFWLWTEYHLNKVYKFLYTILQIYVSNNRYRLYAKFYMYFVTQLYLYMFTFYCVSYYDAALVSCCKININIILLLLYER